MSVRRCGRWAWSVCLGLATVWGMGCAQSPPEMKSSRIAGEIELPDGAVEILPGTGVLDSPVLSADGQRLAVQTEVYRDPALPYEIFSLAVAERDESGAWQPAQEIRQGVYKKYLGRMTQSIQPAFDESGDHLFLTWIEFDSFLSIPSLSTLRSWIEIIPWQGGDARRVVEAEPWGFATNELIQHPRVSPDGRWLTFYTRVHEDQQGVYLLNLQTGERHRLGTQHDKHPTWGPQGKRIWFHNVFAGKRHRFDFATSEIERSALGFYELEFDGDELAGSQRRMMDEPGDEYIFQKHPAILPGTDLLFFHGETKPDGKKKLMVRRATPGSDVYVIDARWPGGKLKELKHPCTSFETNDAIFIAKPKGEKKYRLLLRLTDEAVEEIKRSVK